MDDGVEESSGIEDGPTAETVEGKAPRRGWWPVAVTVIIAVLLVVVPLVVALTATGDRRADERRRACEINMLVINGAINGFCVEKKRYPKTIEEIKGEFLEKVPRCPSGPEPYELEGDNPPRAVCPNDPSHKI